MLNNAPTPSSDTLTDALRKSYDELPYDNMPRYTTHPDCLATAARLRGLEAPPVATARVLELGCSTGVNLIALAVAIPGGRYTGIDLSTAQIDSAVSLAKTLGLEQVHFAAADLRSLAGTLGEFDYIVCHGVYSHVPADVQEAILSICAHSLAPNGVAYVSYNTYPGWHMRSMVRDLLRWHVRDTPDLVLQVARAREFMQVLARHAQPPGGWYAGALGDEARILADSLDSYIAHEHLDPVNEPLYLTEFVARARRHSLEYLGDALPVPQFSDLPGDLGTAVAGLADDPLTQDQYFDCFLGRAFHRTLLCRAAAAPRERTPLETVQPLLARARATPVSEQPRVREIVEENFRTADGYAASSTDPLIKAMLVALRRRAPGMLSFAALQNEVREMLAGAWPACYREDDPVPLAEALLRLHRGSLLSLHTLDIAFATEVGKMPRASPLAREQARTGARVTSLRHDTIELDATQRELLCLLDGTRDRRELLERCPGLSAELLDVILGHMARHALLKQ
ncbi:MAG: class I SAM-dependent methyltransferase [Propionivibrio sp.]|uniref:Class I SAM-dependent methyltransferase n=1 Tax=Candidatus Propionivibrio dominans TaxID=2954373 RepID=A0A9D7II39_9RHOO|nr:class I SAM-dependent methyltransferase [Candidatus Propionivibrio dominans]MBL0167218.1 class I SAM-dependent methyltransferase [Propionivibrio sp.]